MQQNGGVELIGVCTRLPLGTFRMVKAEAKRRGLTTRAGKPNVSAVLCELVREALAGRRLEKPDA